MTVKPTQTELRSIAREWAEFLFEEYQLTKQTQEESDSMKEMVKPTYHEDSK